MIEFLDTSPDASPIVAEYQRLLGYPRNFEIDGRARELCDWARAWYAENGRPWVYARQATTLAVGGDAVVIDDVRFDSARLAASLRDAEADSVVMVAASAGPELEAEAQGLWQRERPDEYFFLEVFGSAVVEHLVMTAGARLCATTDTEGLAVLPHYSPGYPEWDILQQGRLLELLQRSRTHTFPGSLEAMDSGMLRPKKSLLAVFGLAPMTERIAKLADLVPCEGCSLPRCQYRRAAYVRPRRRSEVEAMRPAEEQSARPESRSVLDVGARYSLNAKALKRWVADRLTIARQDDGTTRALFRYDGTTCANTGREFRFHYTVTLGTRDDGYRIIEQHCTPAPGDDGHTYMCRYRAVGSSFVAAIDEDRPMLGRRLNDVLSWNRTPVSASCYCDSDSGQHKWGLVLETIHFALAQLEVELLKDSIAREVAVR